MAFSCRVLAVVGVLGASSLLAQDNEDLGAGDDEGPDAPVESSDNAGPFSHGYLRFGVGNSNGDDFFTFRLDGAQSKYRLGNESDLYGEFGVGYRTGSLDEAQVVGEFMINAYGDSNALNNGAEFAGDSGVIQAYLGVERISDGALRDSFLWIGRRFYRRRDVHMTDFYYENMSGDGIGLEDLRVGSVGVSMAVFYHEDDTLDYTSNALDFRVHDIAVSGPWKGEIGAAYIDGSGVDQLGDDGYSLRFHLESETLSWGEMRNALMFARGAGIDFNSIGAPYAESGDSRIRFVTQALILSSENLESQATAVWERSDIAGEKQTWVSAGIRPQYNFTDDWGAAVEMGYDWFDDDTGSRSLAKITLAPFYSFGQKGYFARPQLRAFVTYAQWSDVGAITEQSAYGTATNGTTLGIQLEHWW